MVAVNCLAPCVVNEPGGLPVPADPVPPNEVLPSLVGNAGRMLVVNGTEDGVEWVDVPVQGAFPVNDISENVTLTQNLRNQLNYASAEVTVTIDLNANQAIEIGSMFTITRTAGLVTIVAVAGVTLNGVDADSYQIPVQWGAATLQKLGADVWVITGSVAETP